MSEREENLINKIIKLENEYNFEQLNEENQKYKNDIEMNTKLNEKLKNEIQNLSSELNILENDDENSSSDNTQIIENKEQELNNLINSNQNRTNKLNEINTIAEKYKNKDYIRSIIQNWSPQTMLKFITIFKDKEK